MAQTNAPLVPACGAREAGVNRLRRGRVLGVDAERRGALELEVEVGGATAQAIAYPDVCGPVGVGDVVVLNTTAVALGLGTGGLHIVVAVESGPDTDLSGDVGRVMKARYTAGQTVVRSVEETHRDVLEASPGLRGTPVVVAPLHSMLAPIAAGAKVSGDARVAYVMTDGAALPGGLSRLVATIRNEGLLDGWISAGQAFGGEVEAVTIWTALLAAVEVLDADVIIVADGPGNLGTDTTWGVSALAGGHALQAATILQGRPVAALRISFADERPRHRGVSHHSRTILREIATEGVDVAVPTLEDDAQRGTVWDALRADGLEDRHQLVEADGRPALAELERRAIPVHSMGRSAVDDPAFFLAAGAAGVLAGRMAVAARAWRNRS